MKRILIIITMLLFTFVKAQVSYNKEPYSKQLESEKQLNNKLPSIKLHDFNNDDLYEKFNCDTCFNDYYGMMMEKNINPILDGVWEKIDDSWIWRIKIISPTAKAVEISFKYFNLKENQYLFAYSSNELKGAYTYRNNQPDSLFIISEFSENEIIIEFNTKIKPIKAPFEIFGFVHVFDEENNFIYKDGEETTGECASKKGVNCDPFKYGWCNEIRASFQLRNIINNEGEGTVRCSATLINNCKNDFKPYVLTATHCVKDREETHSQWIGRFNYQNRECITEGYEERNENGNKEMELVGFHLIDRTSGLNHPDIALLEMYQKPPIGYNVFFAGWEAYDGEYLDGTEVVGLSHPRGTTKKGSHGIVNEKTSPLHKFYEVNWDNGYVDKGSSGSGLFNSNNRLIGVFSWSVFKCKANYGQLAHFYEDIDEYLGDGCDFGRFGHINGADPIWACQEYISVKGNMYPAFDWQDKNDIIIQANNQITADGQMTFNESPLPLPLNYVNYTFRAGIEIILQNGFEVKAGHTFKAEIGSCLNEDGCSFNYPLKAYWESEEKEEFHIEFPNEINLELNQEISIFPNPASEYVFVLFNLKELSDVEIELYDLLGKQLKTIGKRDIQFDKLRIDLSEINSKQIFLSVKSQGKELKIQKILIQK